MVAGGKCVKASGLDNDYCVGAGGTKKGGGVCVRISGRGATAV